MPQSKGQQLVLLLGRQVFWRRASPGREVCLGPSTAPCPGPLAT